MDVVQCHIAVLDLQRLIGLHREDVRNVVATLLIDLDRRCRRRERAAHRRTDKNDHVLKSAIANLYCFSSGIIRRVLLAVRVRGHLNFVVRRRRSLETDLSIECGCGIRRRGSAAATAATTAFRRRRRLVVASAAASCDKARHEKQRAEE
jgi:hypothetical protein